MKTLVRHFFRLIGYSVGVFHTFTFGIFYRPPKGWVANPLTKIRNYPCACKSGKKIKNCHGRPKFVRADDALSLKLFVKNVLKYEKEFLDGKNSKKN